MTEELIRERVKQIADIAHDAETAHAKEDDLYWEFISFIAKDAPSPYRELAIEVLKVNDIDFPRWCA